MKMLVVKLLLSAFIVAELQYATLGRRPKSIPDFGLLVFCKTRSNPLRFNEYGCYCGFGGKGLPVDCLDRCCQIHDNCYGQLERTYNFPSLATYLTPYIVNFLNCRCTNQLTNFQRDLCRCDQRAAECFRRNMRFYNHNYAGYDKQRWCFGPNRIRNGC